MCPPGYRTIPAAGSDVRSVSGAGGVGESGESGEGGEGGKPLAHVIRVGWDQHVLRELLRRDVWGARRHIAVLHPYAFNSNVLHRRRTAVAAAATTGTMERKGEGGTLKVGGALEEEEGGAVEWEGGATPFVFHLAGVDEVRRTCVLCAMRDDASVRGRSCGRKGSQL